MRTIGSLIVILLLTSCAGWQPKDQWLMSANIACQTTDLIQTSEALKNGYGEGNPILGSHPSDGKLVAFKVGETGLVYWLANESPENRTTLLALSMIPCAVVVGHNYKVTH